jgi:hypothetical protein
MNLDELAKEITRISPEYIVQELSRILLEWKEKDHTAQELNDDVEHYLGHTWITSNYDHRKIYKLWASFRDEAISSIGGMTMNERLYHFGLVERFEACSDEGCKLTIYRKLHASPE